MYLTNQRNDFIITNSSKKMSLLGCTSPVIHKLGEKCAGLLAASIVQTQLGRVNTGKQKKKILIQNSNRESVKIHQAMQSERYFDTR